MTAELHSFISDILHGRGLVDHDGFALRSAKALAAVRAWDQRHIKAAINGVRTSIYRRSSAWKRNDLLDLLASRLIRRWKKHPEEKSMVSPQGIRILFVSANPITELSPGVSKTPLFLDEELRQIQAKIRASKLRDSLELRTAMAARPDDLLQAFNEFRPHIVHFSGHGTKMSELVLLDDNREPQAVSKAALEALFKTMRENIRVVTLNACYSKGQAKGITKHIDCVIGMNKAVDDEAAIVFAASFYRGIGFGHSVGNAFEQGVVALKLANSVDHSTPVLLHRKSIDPSKVKLL